MAEILEFLFGSKVKSRLLRFFILNPDQKHTLAEIAKKNMVKASEAKRELEHFSKMKFIIERKNNGSRYYVFNQNFPYYLELKRLIVKSNIYPSSQSFSKIKIIGDIKLVLISGIFINYQKSKADILLVANNINRAKLKNFMNNLEAEIGKEISYVLMTSEEFQYRMNMLDRFVLDFLEGPHDEIVNKIPGLKRTIAGLKMAK
jgi:hypothetical protein